MQCFATKKYNFFLFLELSNKKGTVMLGNNEKPCETIKWMTTKEAAQYLRISPNALRILVYKRRVKFYKLGVSLRFKLDDLKSLIKAKGN